MTESLVELRSLIAKDGLFAPGPRGVCGDLGPVARYISSLIASQGEEGVDIFMTLLEDVIHDIQVDESPRVLLMFAYAIAALRSTSMAIGKPLPDAVLPILLRLPPSILGLSIGTIDCCFMYSTQVGRCLQMDIFISSLICQALITVKADLAFVELYSRSSSSDNDIRPIWSVNIGDDGRALLSLTVLMQTTNISDICKLEEERIIKWSEDICDQIEAKGGSKEIAESMMKIVVARAHYVIKYFSIPPKS